MKLITRITANGRQKLTLTSEFGDTIELLLYYFPTQQSWFCNITVNDFTVNGIAVVRSPNLLRPFKKLINFGIMVDSVDGLDPYYITDFESRRTNLYLLTLDEVNQIEEKVFG